MITLLTQDSIGGLELRKRDGEWIGVPWIVGTFVVSLGDKFKVWTNDRYVSNLHPSTRWPKSGCCMIATISRFNFCWMSRAKSWSATACTTTYRARSESHLKPWVRWKPRTWA